MFFLFFSMLAFRPTYKVQDRDRIDSHVVTSPTSSPSQGNLTTWQGFQRGTGKYPLAPLAYQSYSLDVIWNLGGTGLHIHQEGFPIVRSPGKRLNVSRKLRNALSCSTALPSPLLLSSLSLLGFLNVSYLLRF